MPRGVSPKRQHESKQLVHYFKREGRYRRRAEEVAARIVNKQRAKQGETLGAKAQEKPGKSANRALPLAAYDELTVDQVTRHLSSLSQTAVKRVRSSEQQNRQRKTLLAALDRHLEASQPNSAGTSARS